MVTADELHTPEVIAELEKNHKAYGAVRAEMEAEHWGRTVLLHNGAVVAVYNDQGDAYQIGCENYGAGKFSIYLIGQRPADLGFQSISLIQQVS